MNMWRELDVWMLGWIAPGNEITALTPVAIWLAQWSSLFLLGVALYTLRCGSRRLPRAGLLLLSALLAQALAHTLAHDWNTPRPFMLGLSANHLAHGMRGGMPSAHASVMFALGTALWLTGTRGWLAVLAALPILLTAWARIYTGAHFPLDVLVGAALGATVAGLCTRLSWPRHRSAITSSRSAATMAVAATGDGLRRWRRPAG
ncbi:MAG TPA: phosphatase PAP2 family protein [Macromonas sp.]|nr:phosphatase PAP2 family protein [Macromonas sp.]